MSRTKWIAVVVLLPLTFGSWVVSATQGSDAWTVVEGVNLKAGVTQDQAGAMAQIYFGRYIAGCGSADTLVDRGESWQVTPRIGIAGAKSGEPIIIDKHTGRVSHPGGPTFRNPADLLSGYKVP
ncbi:hypothetical protein [Dyella kyungheensis]|uniref:Uncharacterized protein n=1 Tax=Dyella kyungheensis TaxID=1242174 RepID=A0ABS2JLN4_9GAMM|nr:hypothetical protein [Dyella kyungheensis]MBM7119954.1 hypothetical protein [Dyella kyungheensis]